MRAFCNISFSYHIDRQVERQVKINMALKPKVVIAFASLIKLTEKFR